MIRVSGLKRLAGPRRYFLTENSATIDNRLDVGDGPRRYFLTDTGTVLQQTTVLMLEMVQEDTSSQIQEQYRNSAIIDNRLDVGDGARRYFLTDTGTVLQQTTVLMLEMVREDTSSQIQEQCYHRQPS
ncbi:hypothetical protein RRG08_000738 [Elysia crispata]|uniref:Uncharacterized protein n=1 Tax=Elysia crispata TaxID=231223 RepID=A0AAE1AFR4_9GAST|nr:hypothetical protein RRG08_000738 [Elysia crispata]